MIEILSWLYFMLPAYIANMMPVFVKKLPILDYPMDFKQRIRGYRVLGAHKTWRGFVAALVAGCLTFYVQVHWYNTVPFLQSISLFDYSTMWPWFGMMMGFGAIAGDAVKSFVKRQNNIKSGKSWMPFDQVDYTIGAIIAVSPWFLLSWEVALFIIIFSGFLHIAVNYIGYKLGINKVKF